MTSRYPFTSYPNGWFRVAYSSELGDKEVKPLRYFGQDLVLYRDAEGTAHVLSAFCAHLGAHMGYGGRVEGSCLRCPFHGWVFEPGGQCHEVPYARKVPSRATVGSWPTRERNGLILVHHHAEGAQPSWEVDRFPEYASEEWTPYRDFRLKLRVHIQETAENGVDTAHLHVVHGVKDPVAQADMDRHLMRVLTRMRAPMIGGQELAGTIDMTYYGLGVTPSRVHIGPLQWLFLTTVTPIDEEYVDARFIVSLKKLPSEEATAVVLGRVLEDEEQQVRRDIPIWENKSFPHPPLLCDGDGPIGPFRRWAKQFYTGLTEAL